MIDTTAHKDEGEGKNEVGGRSRGPGKSLFGVVHQVSLDHDNLNCGDWRKFACGVVEGKCCEDLPRCWTFLGRVRSAEPR